MTALHRPRMLAAVTALAIAAGASPAAAQFKDQLVQVPKLSAPERGSVQGALSGIGFAATELARGAYRLPLSISAPQDRGPLQASVIPAYSPDAGLSEWGMGWSVDLSIKRHRLVGEIDYVHDDLVSPWGRLRPGSDGNLYPTGLSTAVRVSALGSDWLAVMSDGAQYRFSAASGVITADGVYAWQLIEVVSIEGDRTTLEWTKNTSGRPFLTRVTWGGRSRGSQYELVPSYEALAIPFVDHTTGTALDRRVTSVKVSVRDAVTGTLRERWRYQLGYRPAPFGPAFYLETLQRRFASGELQPAMVYRYELDDTRLPAAALERYTGLDAILGDLGDGAVQPDRATLSDIDADGQPDLEHAEALTQIQHTAAGWVRTALPPATGVDPRCRPSARRDNEPRLLARMTADIGPPHVLFTRLQSVEPVTSEILVCDRLGHPLADLSVADDWQLGPNVRLIDVDRDRRPDLVRVTSSGIDVLRNDSDAQGIRFVALPRFTWSLDFDPEVSWLNDFDGDGNIDVTIRSTGGLWVLFGLGQHRWTTSPVLFRCFGLDDDALGTLTPYQLTFVDANKDGLADVLLTDGIFITLYTNRGDAFREVSIPGFRNLQAEFGLPIIADLTGRGNTEVAFPTLGTTYVVQLATPSSGLLASADDGMGTVLRFGYARSAPRAGIEQRTTLLDSLTIASSGYDTVSYRYSYGDPVLHSVGKQLVGFASVDKHSPLLTEHVAFLNDDDVSGVNGVSEDTDDRTPGILRFSQRRYDDARFHGVRWLRLSLVESGYRSADGVVSLSTTTAYSAYQRERCPTVTVTTGPSGQLVTTSTLASTSAIPDDLHCLTASQSLSGRHPDPALDFDYMIDIGRNPLGQVTQITQYGPSVELLVLQDVTYDADHRVASIGSPGRGTTTVRYDALGRRTEITDPLGVVTRAGALDPVTDALLALATVRPDAPTTAFFTYDGKERLQASWDDVSGSSATRPGASYRYREATNAAPGRIDTQTLADALTGVSRRAVDLIGADGETLVGGTWLGTRFAFGMSTITTRGTLTRRSAFVGPMTDTAVAAITSADLRGLGSTLEETLSAGFGHEIQTTRTQQAGVVGTTTNELLLDTAELVTREHQPGGFSAESAVDAAGKLVRKTDERGVVHRYTYDALGRLVHVATPDGGHSLTFDGFGRPARVTRDGIGAVSYAYDPISGQLVGKQRLDATGAITDTSITAYDAIGRQIQVAQTAGGSDAALQFGYDGQLGSVSIGGQLGRATRVQGDGWERTELFDPLGRPYEQHITLTGWRELTSDKTYRADGSVASDTLTVADSGGTVTFSTTKETVLDSLGRIAALKIDGAVLYTLSYDAEGRIARADFTAGETIVFDYDPVTHERRGHVVEAPETSGSVHWERDPRGLVAAETYGTGTTTTRRTYTYDGRGELTRAATPTDIATYTYTASGLPDSISDRAGARSVHRTGRTLAVGASVYTWDAAGRVAGKDGWTFRYGPNGQLARATRPGRQLDYVYDELNNRLLKRVNGAPVRAEVAGGVLTEDHFIQLVAIGGVVAGVLDNGEFIALLTDPRGTPFTGPDGTPGLASPYGVRVSHLGLAEVIDYARLGWDPDLDVVRMGVRDYDARLAQFLTPDPLYFEDLEKCQDSPLECSLYGYAGGNPISFVDPTGTGVWSWTKGVASDVADFTVHEIAPRAVGALKVVGGTAIAAAGTALCTTGAGCVIGGLGVAYGADVAASGVAQTITGHPTSTQTNKAIASISSQQSADNFETALNYVMIGTALSRSPYLTPRAPASTPSPSNLNCFVAGTMVATPTGPVAIEDLRLGDRVEAGDPRCDDEHLAEDAVTIGLELANPHRPAETFHVELVRSRAWLQARDLGDGWANINFAEGDAYTRARVTHVRPAPHEQPGPGCLVLMTTEHVASEILKLRFETGSELEVTPLHPLFLEDHGWTFARDLRAGSRLRTDRGPIRLDAVEPAPATRSVFNLEVGLAHTYRVSPDRIWVHNDSVVLDTNAVIAAVEHGQAATILAGRTPIVPIQVVREFLARGASPDSLRAFLQANGGRIGAVATENAVGALRTQAAVAGRSLKVGDAHVAATAKAESRPVVTQDRKFRNFLNWVGIGGENF